MESTTLAISKIRTDGGTQSRESIDDDVVAEYATRMTSGEKFPPIVVYHDGKDYWLADGFHRVRAGELCGQAVLNADIRQGTVRDAILYSVGANAQHGIRRTNADKRRAVLVLLNDEQWSRWSNNEIAAKCGVGAPLVSELRKSLTISSYSEPRTYTTRHGTTATMNTENIGRTPAAVAELPENDATASEIGNYFSTSDQTEDEPEIERDGSVNTATGKRKIYYEEENQIRKDETPTLNTLTRRMDRLLRSNAPSLPAIREAWDHVMKAIQETGL